MKKNKLNDRFLPSMVVVGIVAIVAIVTLFLWSGRIEGAPIYSHVDEEVEGCLDTDPENDIYRAGIVKKAFTQYEDYCLNEKSLFQHYCDYNQVKLTSSWDCEYGCNRGKCVERLN